VAQILSYGHQDAVFTPSEVEAITGVSPLLQRTWRRRGFLGEQLRGPGTCTAHELAQVMGLQIAAQNLNVDLKFVHEGVRQAAPAILFYALGYAQAWDIQGTPEEVAAFEEHIKREVMYGLQYLHKMVDLRKEHWGRYFVRRKDSWSFELNLDAFFDGEDTTSAIVLDLMAIGKALAESPDRSRALITVNNIQVETSQRTGTAVAARQRNANHSLPKSGRGR
jgi:hypothetical protein